ncbi:hypothetical protein KIH86_16475 [Paenibacillus sp. HN-1]|uniref:hypothetical protein n=1 Tax=Paenibacillus TaxID=44249 RepID=UPI001CA9E7FE|nr:MULTISPECIES: hypothetical protein [Paenibacillus]MBY9082040.1 hypothetical protein [Paenibacillus sp. CGMCC 1.18879]MBY9085802.1 hypothetical protein [Paenibacillus sinensis]
MARSWERMVQRNSQQLNQKRKKEGKESISATRSQAQSDVFKGRNIMFPVVLVTLGLLYALIAQLDSASAGSKNGGVMSWIGVVLYFALAALIYFRRPYLKVERSRVSTFKFNRMRILEAGDIEKIIVSRASLRIKPKGKRGQWAFSRLINRYDTDAMGERMEQFAKLHHIPLEKE